MITAETVAETTANVMAAYADRLVAEVVAAVDISFVRVPPALVEVLDRKAEERGMTRSEIVMVALQFFAGNSAKR